MFSRYFFVFLGILLAGCTAPAVVDVTLSPEATLTPTVVTPAPTEEPEPDQSGPVFLEIWIPPEFDPASDTPEGAILQARLDEFMARRSNIHIETRIKDPEGPGGIVDTLGTAAAAAPLALPDLVLLPAQALESAAIKGLIHSFDGLTVLMDGTDWYEYARQLSHVQNSTFGIPFAGDSLLMVYRPSVIGDPPTDWATSLTITDTLAFPAADPDSLVTLGFYQSTGGAILDEENRPTLETAQLTGVFTYYQQASASALMPFWITQFETDTQIWEAYQGSQTNMIITWASKYLQTLPADSNAAPLPTANGVPFTLATGWAWALASPDPDRQALSAQLAEFLSTSEFVALWTETAGYLPARPSALGSWEDVTLQALLNPIAASAQLIPSPETLSTLGPILQTATIDLLKNQADPITAAESAAAKLAPP